MELTWRNFWFESKAEIKAALGMSEDMIHVHFGLALFLIGAVLLRNRRKGVLIAWCVGAFLQIVNEVLDAREWINWTGNVNWSEFLKDTGATLFWPTVLVLIWRWIGRRPS